MYQEKFDWSINDKDVKTCPKSPCGGESNKHSNSNPEIIDGSGSSMGSKGQIDFIPKFEEALESDENKCSKIHTHGTGSILDSARGSSSSSSSELSSDDGFIMETVKFKSGASRPASKDEQNDVSSDSSAKSEVDNSCPVPMSTFQFCDVINNQTGLPPTISPPVQVMDPSGGYDPNRIPSSVFARNTNPMEWSTASNESLFSIHVENNSFSQDHAVMFNEFGKSGELTKSGEFCIFSPPPLVIIEDIDTDRKSVGMEDLQTTEMSEEAFKSEESLCEDQNKVKNSEPAISCNSSNVSSNSRWSGTSKSSFAFPILTEAERSSSVKTDVPRQKSFKEASAHKKKKASEVKSSSKACCCNWFDFKCFSCSCIRWGKFCRCC